MEIREIAELIAAGIQQADADRPVAANARTGVRFQPGIGPHSESETTRMALAAAVGRSSSRRIEYRLEVPYPLAPRTRCDVCIGDPDEWAVEVKMLRLMGDNGKPNDNMLMHVLSPYPAHHSALTDCEKLTESGFDARKGVLIFGYDYERWPMDPAIEAFERLASAHTTLSQRSVVAFDGLVHPVHRRGRVFGWQLQPK